MCDEYIVLINMLIDGEASPDDENRLKEHLKQCKSCRMEYERLSLLVNKVRSMNVDIPDNLHGSIMSAIPNAKQIKIPFYKTKMFGFAMAACLMIVAAGAFLPSVGQFFAPKSEAYMDNSNPDSYFVISTTNEASPQAKDAFDDGLALPEQSADKAHYEMDSDNAGTFTGGSTFGYHGNYILSGNATLPEIIEKYNPEYIDGEAVIKLDNKDVALDVYTVLKKSGFKECIDSILKSIDVTLPTKVHLVKAMVFQWSSMDARVGL